MGKKRRSPLYPSFILLWKGNSQRVCLTDAHASNSIRHSHGQLRPCPVSSERFPSRRFVLAVILCGRVGKRFFHFSSSCPIPNFISCLLFVVFPCPYPSIPFFIRYWRCELLLTATLHTLFYYSLFLYEQTYRLCVWPRQKYFQSI